MIRTDKVRIQFGLLFLLIPLILTSCSNAGEDFTVSGTAAVQKAPNFTLLNLKGEPVTLSSYRNEKPVLLFFWATWCPFCRQQMPGLARLRERYSPEELEILAIDIQETPEKVAAYAAKQGVRFTMLLDQTGAVASSYNVTGIPLLVLIDKDGNRIQAGNEIDAAFRTAIERSVS